MTPQPSTWQERFNEKFIDNKREDEEYYRVWERDNDIKKFFASELAAIRKQVEDLPAIVIQGRENNVDARLVEKSEILKIIKE